MIILGIDPGNAGALAWVHGDGALLHVEDMPTAPVSVGKKIRTRPSPAILASLLRKHPADRVVLEDPNTRPGEGAVGAFAFGRGLGMIEGVVAAMGLPVLLVPPATWKKDLQLSADKSTARHRAIQNWPNLAEMFARVKDDGRAEAALIGLYGVRRWIEPGASRLSEVKL